MMMATVLFSLAIFFSVAFLVAVAVTSIVWKNHDYDRTACVGIIAFCLVGMLIFWLTWAERIDDVNRLNEQRALQMRLVEKVPGK